MNIEANISVPREPEKKDQLPVQWEEELARQARALAAQERPSVGKLSFRGGIMAYQGNAVQGNALNCIILASAFEHALYDNVLKQRAFNPQDPEPPVCFALANPSPTGEKPDMIPHPASPMKAHTHCSACSYFAWGSDPKGGRGKACKEVRRMLLIGESAVWDSQNQRFLPPDGVRKAEAATVNVPVTSVKNWANYAALVAGQYSMPPWAFVTRLSCVPDAKTQFQIKFEVLRPIDKSFYPELYERVKLATQILMTPYTPKQPQELRQNVKY